MREHIADNAYEVKCKLDASRGSVPRAKTASDPAQLDLIDAVNAAAQRDAQAAAVGQDVDDEADADLAELMAQVDGDGAAVCAVVVETLHEVGEADTPEATAAPAETPVVPATEREIAAWAERILPAPRDGCVYLLGFAAEPDGEPRVPKICWDIRELMQSITAHTKARHNTWLSIGLYDYKAATTWLAVNPDKTARQSQFIVALKAIKLEVDLASATKPNGHESVEQAHASLNAACDSLGIPRPMVIRSGGGLHVYIPLSREVAVAEHVAISQALKAALLGIDPKLGVDTVRWCDPNGWLRPVGGKNFKTRYGVEGRAVVEIAAGGGDWDVDAALAWAGTQGVSPSVTHSATYTAKERAYAYSSNVLPHLVQRAVAEREKVDAARANGEPYPWHSGMARQAYDDRHYKARNDWRIERELASPEWIEATGVDPDISFATRTGCRKFILRLVRELKVGMPEAKARALYHQFAANDPGYGSGNRAAADNEALFDHVLAEAWDRLRCERVANLNNLFDQRASAGLSDDETPSSNNNNPGSEHVS